MVQKRICGAAGCSNVARSQGYGKRGKLCEKHHRRKYPRRDGYRVRRSRAARLRSYGITAVEYQARLAGQQGNCSICGKALTRPHIDHCHSTGKTRGLLCGKCNVGLGMFDDNIDILASAVSYLINSKLKDCG